MTLQEKKHHHELKLELQGVHYYANSNEVEGKDAEGDAAYDLNQIAEDAANMSKIGMSGKNRKQWEAMKVRQSFGICYLVLKNSTFDHLQFLLIFAFETYCTWLCILSFSDMS